MTQLFNRAGVEHQPTRLSDKGKPYRAYGTACPRCGGVGGSEAWRHTGYTCFDCGGSGRGPTRVEPLYTAEQLAKLNAMAEKRNAKKTAKRNAEIAAERERAERLLLDFAEKFPDVHQWLTAQDSHNGFAVGLREQLLRKGTLSEAQIAAARKIIERESVKSAHVGTVGERREFNLTVNRVLAFEISRYPTIISYTNICRDEAGNVIVYRGANAWEQDETLRVKATIKAHDEYKGVAQTFISRPKLLEEA